MNNNDPQGLDDLIREMGNAIFDAERKIRRVEGGCLLALILCAVTVAFLVVTIMVLAS